ncbi:thioesterase domain-containing protein [Coleofasciculus sp. E2-BRE-01]|uniref:thioesterase domain-containing protein n=1 Tax=Coleofasciculus sp. E2-BRE-01 TaxID=3069524 RepID=UPI0040636C89
MDYLVDPGVTYPKLNPQANLRLFCFPYAGGAARIFRTWSDSCARECRTDAVYSAYPAIGFCGT